MSIKCGTCVNFEKGKARGKIKTSRACNSWQPNWQLLSLELKLLYKHLTRLSVNDLEIFKLYWNNKRIDKTFTPWRVGKRCGACVYFNDCEHSPKRSDYPARHACNYWDLDLPRKIKSKYCPKSLKIVVRLVESKRIKKPEYSYIDHFIKMQEIVNKVKEANNVKIVVGDKVDYQVNDKVVSCKVVGLTPEYVQLKYGKAHISVIYGNPYILNSESKA